MLCLPRWMEVGACFTFLEEIEYYRMLHLSSGRFGLSSGHNERTPLGDAIEWET